eukprot:1987872-Alexandrium_andersonii.AAC.1
MRVFVQGHVAPEGCEPPGRPCDAHWHVRVHVPVPRGLLGEGQDPRSRAGERRGDGEDPRAVQERPLLAEHHGRAGVHHGHPQAGRPRVPPTAAAPEGLVDLLAPPLLRPARLGLRGPPPQDLQD